MYLERAPDREYWVFDIECDSLDPTVVWVVCVRNLETGEERTLTDYEEIQQTFAELVAKRACLIGHNCIGYDAPNLNRLVGCRIPYGLLVDTFVLSSLYSPSMAGGHSLESWGERLRDKKGEYNDWSRLTSEMISYCQQDVRLTAKIYEKLTERMRAVGFSERSAEIETRAWCLIQKQKRNGFQLDVPRANALFAELREEERQFKEKIYEIWPPKLERVAEFKNAYKKDGNFSANYERHLGQYPRIEIRKDGSYSAFDRVEFNLGSPTQRIAKLLEVGWEPVKFTKKGNPQVDEDSLTAFALSSGREEITSLAKWIVVNSRANMIGNWLDNADDKGLIHGTLWLAGTLRYRHSNPNTANIPAVRLDSNDEPLLGSRGLWTYDSRDLWVTRDSDLRSLVGVDAKGIQLRILAHYVNDQSFTEAILSSDPHAANQRSMGLATRALTKTITYATLMGAGDQKIANEAKISLPEAKAAKATFFEQVPGLRKLINRLKAELEKTGRITLCDGSRVLVPSDHMVIPYLLQGDESRIMKQAGLYVDATVRRERIDALKVGDIHDEWQTDVLNSDIERFIDACKDGFSRAGKSFGYNLPIECDSKVGKTWAETH